MNFLFVGRIAPNKKIEDHIRLAEHYKRYVDAYYRFIFVGRYDVGAALLFDDSRADGRVPAAATIGSSSPARCPTRSWPSTTGTPRVYISLSEHEGFCVPLLEAMAADVPVLAYAAAAVPDTLGGAGVQFAPKDLEYAAELLGALAFDDDLRAQVIAGQRRRLADFGDARIARELDRRCSQLHCHEDRLHRPALRHRGPRRLRASLPADRRAARRPARRRGADDLRARLRHLEERVSRGRRPHPRRHRPPVRQRARRATSTRSTRYSDWIFNNPHTPRRRDGVAEAAGTVVPGAASTTCSGITSSTTSLIFFTYLYAPTVLGLEVAPARSILVPTAHDEPAIQLEIFKDVFSRPAALCYLTESERQFVQRQFRRSAAARRSRSASASTSRSSSRTRACRPAAERRRAGRRRATDADGRRAPRASFRRICSRAAPCSAAGIGCTARSRSTAAASIPARAARS